MYVVLLYILHFFVRSNRIQLVFDIDVWRIWKCLLLDLYSKSKLHNLHSYLFWVSYAVLCKVVLEGCVNWPLVYYSKSPHLIRMTILVAKLQYRNRAIISRGLYIFYRAALLQNWIDVKNNCQHEVTSNNNPRGSSRNLLERL